MTKEEFNWAKTKVSTIVEEATLNCELVIRGVWNQQISDMDTYAEFRSWRRFVVGLRNANRESKKDN